MDQSLSSVTYCPIDNLFDFWRLQHCIYTCTTIPVISIHSISTKLSIKHARKATLAHSPTNQHSSRFVLPPIDHLFRFPPSQIPLVITSLPIHLVSAVSAFRSIASSRFHWSEQHSIPFVVYIRLSFFSKKTEIHYVFVKVRVRSRCFCFSRKHRSGPVCFRMYVDAFPPPWFGGWISIVDSWDYPSVFERER